MMRCLSNNKCLLLALVCACIAWTGTGFKGFKPPPSRHHNNRCVAAKNNSKKEVDVSDLGLTMENLEAPLPSEMLQGIATSGYESTSRLPTVDDQGCSWVEGSDSIDVTLAIPGLRGQPAACLAVQFSTTTATITAFGRPVWSCVLKGEILPTFASFSADDGPDMVPVLQLSVQKADPSTRWRGFIEQIGEDSIL